ncbi:MAG: hypothetical protein LBL26_04660 [Peptococcaceae bacterium]|jgi:hypothetical protein|nr:hypothetical protein [Peptococcaceae bacterium]
MIAAQAREENVMTDYQFKQVIVMIYRILEANVQAGKSPEELLKVVAQLLKEPKFEETD